MMEGVVILGVVRAENDEETMIIDNSQTNPEGLVPTNRIPEICDDLMDIDNASNEASKEMQENTSRVECGIAIGHVENLKHPEGIDASQAVANGEKKDAKKQLKRKRTSSDWVVDHETKKSLEAACRKELDELFEYYKEFSGINLQIEDGTCYSNNMMVALLLEEKNLPFSKLVEEIHEKLKGRDGFALTSVRSTVLFVGQRMMYGLTNADADVLEDQSASCLWCWETRDMKSLPKYLRGMINIRRTARRKIHERISVVSETLYALSSFKDNDSCRSDLSKASMKLDKVLNRNEISSLVEKLKLKHCAEMAEKDAKLKQKELIKEIEKNKKTAEKEKKKMDRELEKEKVHSEKELKRLKDEAERQQKRREKEEAEEMKQIKKLEKRAAREERRREKEDAEVKKQLVLQKQASIMDRFLIKNKKSSNSSETIDMLSPMTDSTLSASKADAAISSMDSTLSQPCDYSIEDLRRFHVVGWRKFHSNKHRRWGIRHTPKTEVIKELKLQTQFIGAESNCTIAIKDKDSSPSESNNETEASYDKLADELQETFDNDIRCQSKPVLSSAPDCLWHKKLLQFDKSHRPAYYGTWHKKSNVVGPRRPFQKDPELDYDVDSDEEWEEEDPGESLSDCEKDNEEPCDEDNLKSQDGDESEDSFVVPDGYLSENEGVHTATSSDPTEDEVESSPSCKLEDENEEFRLLLQQQKFLQNLTEKALRKSQPLVISNLNHEKYELLIAEAPVGTAKLEKICMQTLCMRPCPEASAIDNSGDDNMVCKDQECPQAMTIHISKEKTTKMATAAVISDSDLPEFVKLIQSYHHGINKVVEALQQKFPTISKLQLRNKIRETSDFIDNRWQVKKDVLDKLGLSVTPERAGKPKSIATYFSKRCLPPQGSVGISESSPEQCSEKRASNDQDQNHQSQPMDCDTRRLF